MSALDIFPGEADDFYTVYDVAVQIRDRLVGGIPASESTIRAWLAKKLDAGDARLEELVQETLAAIDQPLSVDDKLAALMANPDVAAGNVFKRHPDGTGELMFEGRCVKAAFKEAANSVYPGTDWDGKRGDSGKTVGKGDKVKFAAKDGIPERKGLKAFAAEAVMVLEDLIPTGAKEFGVDFFVEERVKHVITPQGPRSAISRVEVIPKPVLHFTMKVRNDFLTRQAWSKLWQASEELGLGSDRARSDGRFDLIQWDKRDSARIIPVTATP